MSEIEPQVPEETGLSRGDALRIAGYTGVGALGIFAVIYGGVAVYAHPQSVTSALEELSITMLTSDEEPEPLAGACFEPFNWKVEPLASGAYDCMGYQDSARIALVNYTFEDIGLERVANEVEQELLDQTNGLVSAEVTAISVSDTVRQRYIHAQPPNQDCADNKDVRVWGSTLAKESMPQLDSYDAVVGVTHLPACNAGAPGIADPQLSLAEVHFPHGMREDSLDTDVVITTHEILHFLRVGHEGTLEIMYEPGIERATKLDTSVQSLSALVYNLPTGEPLDLRRYIVDGTYHEYRGPSAMGPPQALSGQSRLNTLQQYLLEWPQRATGQEVSIKGHDLANGAVTFASGDKNSIALLELDEHMTPSSVEYDNEHLPPYFGLLAFAPRDPIANIPVAVDIYALDERGDSTALLGTVQAVGGENRSVELTMGGGQSVHLNIDAQANAITLTPASK